MSLLQKNSRSAYGQAHGFSGIRTAEDYRQKVPVVTYDDLDPWMQRVQQGEAGVLTEEKILLLEPTGGSSGSRKWIPYTETLKRQFQSGIEAWLYDIYKNYPGTDQGKAYWMITPPFSQEELADAGVPVGFDDDAEYLGSFGRRMLARLMVRPAITPGMDTEAFYQETLTALVNEPALALLSVWNPGLLLNLLDYLTDHTGSIAQALPRNRSDALGDALRTGDFRLLWPKLAFVSCWADASAQDDARRLAARLPGAVLQPKGLLSTECMVSFPTRESLAHGGMLPAYHTAFLEFSDGERFFFLHELEKDKEYEVIVTTGGGLYRYASGDRVQVTGRLRDVPLLRFCGRTNTVDLAGEKMTPGFVENAFSDLDAFYLLSPVEKGYVLYTSADIRPEHAEARLFANYHYRLARRLGQLAPLRVFRITGDAERQYLDQCRRRGQRLGDIKPVRLSARNEYSFTGEFHD